MFTGSIKQIVASIGLGLGLAVLTYTAPMTDSALAATTKPVLQPKPSTGGYTIKDMHDCVPSGSNGDFICYGPDNKTYVCKTTGACTRLVGW